MMILMGSRPLLNRYSLAGLGATLIGNGIGRFAYIALMPALIQAGWFSPSDASYLGVATLIGYIFGAPAANLLIKYFTLGQLIRVAMLMSSISYLGCALEGAPLMWFYVLRTLAGICRCHIDGIGPSCDSQGARQQHKGQGKRRYLLWHRSRCHVIGYPYSCTHLP
jgi:MFS family permease